MVSPFQKKMPMALSFNLRNLSLHCWKNFSRRIFFIPGEMILLNIMID